MKRFVRGQRAGFGLGLLKAAGWRRMLALGLVCALLPGCSLNLTRVFIPLAYGGIGMGIALLVSPSVSAAIVGFVLGGIIGAAVYNNSLKTDLMERQDPLRSFRP